MSFSSFSRLPRPLSPHLTVYKKQLSSGMSIFHRLTGLALFMGLPVLALWLTALSFGPQFYGQATDFFKTTVGRVFLIGWIGSFFYHYCNGIRYLIWGTGRMLGIKEATTAGYIVLFISFVMTLLFGFYLFEVL